jgi:hypothetical protein
MIPLTVLCKQLIAWAYAVFVEEAPKRRIKQLQNRLNLLILQIDIAAGRVKRTDDGGIIGSINMFNGSRRYLNQHFERALQVYGTVTGRMSAKGSLPPIQGQFQNIRKTTNKPPSTPVPRQLTKNASFGALYGTSPKGLRALYGDRPSPEGDAERAFRMARYYAYSEDEALLEDAILLLKRYYPLEAMAIEL